MPVSNPANVELEEVTYGQLPAYKSSIIPCAPSKRIGRFFSNASRRRVLVSTIKGESVCLANSASQQSFE
ncbi:MAG: hypothetical protein QM538_04780 [Methylacidiphilales bacterium]|nr:hypothetical protein [Candidatus Methylacidiphilales bacterium]